MYKLYNANIIITIVDDSLTFPEDMIGIPKILVIIELNQNTKSLS